MHYIGLDIHKAFTYGIIEDAIGEVIKAERFSNTNENFSKFLEGTTPHETKIVMESTGVWEFIHDLIEESGYKVILANSLRTKAIASAKIKTDAIDARTLADLLRANLIPESYVPSKEMRKLREKVRSRKSLVKTQTQMINKIKAILNKQGINLPWKSWGKRSREWILEYDFKNKDLVIKHINILNQVEKELNTLEKEIENIAYYMKETKLLMTIPGIGPIHSVTVFGEIADYSRFSNGGKLCCYAGLIPGLRQSGNRSYYTGLIRQSTKTIKHELIQAAWVTVRTKEPNSLQLYYKRLLKKKGKKVAICATARKMLTIAYSMLKNNQEFIA